VETGGAGAAAGAVWVGVDGAAAVVTVCPAVVVFFAVGLAAATSPPAAGLLLADTGVDDEDEEPAAAAMPMTNTRPQNARNAVSSLCLASHGFRPGGPASPSRSDTLGSRHRLGYASAG
jgi:hypothetical protein